MADDMGVMSPLEKAAVFLMSLGETAAAEVIRHLGPREVQLIGTEMAKLQNVTRDMVAISVADFVADMRVRTPLGIKNDEYIRKVLTRAHDRLQRHRVQH
jgi:flagellar motor switch protein FliG